MKRRLSPDLLRRQVRFSDLARCAYDDLVTDFRSDEQIAPWKPMDWHSVDPRSGDRIVYAPVRARRPHDNRPPMNGLNDVDPCDRACPVCQGETTSVIDVAPLSCGFTFINKNLYPIVYPREQSTRGDWQFSDSPGDGPVEGLHFLQWTSTYHDDDIHTLSSEDVYVVMKRLALLEEKLLHGGGASATGIGPRDSNGHAGYVAIIKNHGYLVGGSLRHGHQQIVHTNVMPRIVQDDRLFEHRHGRSFASDIAEKNPVDLDVVSEDGVRVLVPWFMKRPLHCLVVVNEDAEHLHHLSSDCLFALGKALKIVLGGVRHAMVRLGRPPTFNMTFHLGSGRMYVELHPYTQEMGGYEHMGLYVCQDSPAASAALLRCSLKEVEE